MEVPEHRKWMNCRVDPERSITEEFFVGIQEFVDFARRQEQYRIEGKIRCPCKKCKCRKFENVDDVLVHLCRKGFMDNYYYWTNHGEPILSIPLFVIENSYYGNSGEMNNFNNYEQMIMDYIQGLYSPRRDWWR